MSEQQEARLGQQFGEYRLVRKLGGGGFGIVYLAKHVHEHTQAAVKVLDIRLTKSEDFKEFINEARTIRLHHPNIVSLLDFGISRDDLPFLVMEYAPQGTLRDRHPRGERVPLSTIVAYVDQLASALQYAHDHRVIHRDIKPENVLVRADGTLLVSDFGIAKFLEQSLLTSMHKLAGTPTYMSPEQQKGKPCFASDQYALAVVIYEWICGVRPFQGTVFGLAVQHMSTPPPSLREHLPTLPEAVERVVFKALAKAPEDRFGRIQEFADALREAVQPPMVLSPSIETIDTARLAPAIQTADVPVSHHRSTPALHSPLPVTPGNAAFPQKRPLGNRFSLLTRISRGLILLLIVLVVTLFGGGIYVVGSVYNSANQLSNAQVSLDQANAELTQNPIDALKQLALAQQALVSLHGPFLVGDQATRYNTLEESLRKTLQKAVAAYNQKELITQLSCTSNQSVTLSGKVQPVSLSTIRDEKGTTNQFVLAADDNLYRLDEQNVG